MNEGDAWWRRWSMPAAIVTLVVVLVVVALSRGPVELDPDSPEGTVQEYLIAIDEGRWEDAVSLVHPDWLGACEPNDLATFGNLDFSAELGRSDAGGLGGLVEERFDVAGPEEGLPAPDTLVEVTINRDGGGGFGSGWSEFVVFELVDQDDFWWISGDPWPYFVWNCR